MIDHDWFLVELYFPGSDLMMFQLLQTSESWTFQPPNWPEDAHCGHSGQCGGHDPVGWVCTYWEISQMAGGAKVDGKKQLDVNYIIWNMTFVWWWYCDRTERGCRCSLWVLTRYCIYPPASRYKPEDWNRLNWWMPVPRGIQSSLRYMWHKWNNKYRIVSIQVIYFCICNQVLRCQ